MIKPRGGNAAICRLVVGEFFNYIHLGTGVTQHIHKIVDHHIQLIIEKVAEIIVQLFAIMQGGDFVVAEFHVATIPFELLVQEKFFMHIFTALIRFAVVPFVRKTFFDFGRHQTGKKRITRKFGAGG